MSSVFILPASAADIEDAYLWYQHKRPGLGEKFLSAVGTALRSISVHPEKGPVIFRGTRRVLLRRFPYGLYYRVTDRGTLLIACFHVSRSPRRWKQRA